MNILAKVGSSLGVIDEHQTSAFKSEIKRDIMEQVVGKDVMENPGPGSYDTLIQEKLKTLNF
jgi:hypothetical protein